MNISNISSTDLAICGSYRTSQNGGPDVPFLSSKGLLVNGTKLLALDKANFQAMPDVPKAIFPYKRLACAHLYNSSSFNLYHQVNATTLVEETWSEEIRAWSGSEIPVRIA